MLLLLPLLPLLPLLLLHITVGMKSVIGRYDSQLAVITANWYRRRTHCHTRIHSQVSGLPQIVRNTFWDDGCPLISMRDVLPMNCVFWPANPFNLTDYDGNGTFKHKSKEQFPPIQQDDILVVITHHEGNARK